MTEDHAEFRRALLRIMAVLYEHHPRPVSLTPDTVLRNTSKTNEYGEHVHTEALEVRQVIDGTIGFLEDNGYIFMKRAAISDAGVRTPPLATLSAAVYRTLIEADPQEPTRSLGAAASSTYGDAGLEDRLGPILATRLLEMAPATAASRRPPAG